MKIDYYKEATEKLYLNIPIKNLADVKTRKEIMNAVDRMQADEYMYVMTKDSRTDTLTFKFEKVEKTNA